MKNNYMAEEATTAPTIVEATCTGSEIWIAAWARGDKVAVRKGTVTKATFAIVTIPKGVNADGVHEKLSIKFKGDDVAELSDILKGLTSYGTITVRGVSTLKRSVFIQPDDGERKLYGIEYFVRNAKFTVTPCADEALKEFDGPVAQIEPLPYEKKTISLVGSEG